MRVADNSNRRLLLLSNSRDESGRFLQHTGSEVSSHFAGVRKITFVPFAAVTIGWDAYTQYVREAMAAFVLAQAMLEKFGGDSLVEVERNLHAYLARLDERQV